MFNVCPNILEIVNNVLKYFNWWFYVNKQFLSEEILTGMNFFNNFKNYKNINRHYLLFTF